MINIFSGILVHQPIGNQYNIIAKQEKKTKNKKKQKKIQTSKIIINQLNLIFYYKKNKDLSSPSYRILI